MVSWTVSADNDAAMAACIAMRLAQDGATISIDDALAEMLLIAGIDQNGNTSGPSVKQHGGRFVQ